MKDGLIQQLDTPKQIYNKPANLFVAGFIGSPSMNFLNAKFEKSNQNIIVGNKYLENKEVELIARNGESSINPVSDLKTILDFFKTK